MGDNSNIITNNEPPPYRRKIHVPNQGLYYTVDNVENDLPKLPVKRDPVPKPKLDPYDSPAAPAQRKSEFAWQNPNQPKDKIDKNINKNIHHGIQYPAQLARSQNIQKAKNKETKNSVDVITPWYLKPIVNSTADRAIGRPARVIKVGLRNQEGKRSETHIIFLKYQMMTGAMGGIFMGVETGYLTLENKMPAGNNDTLVLGKPVEKVAQNSLVRPAVIFWRTTKRGVAAALLFNFIEKNIEEFRSKSDWKNSAYTGALCGYLYGLRGGFSCAMTGCAVFAAFGGMSGIYDQLKRRT